MNKEHTIVAILAGIVLATGFIMLAVMTQDHKLANLILLTVAALCAFGSAASSFILMHMTKHKRIDRF